MDSDKIMVLEEGRVVEFDHPYNLLQNKDSQFYELITKTKDLDFLDLMEMAEEVIIKYKL